MKGYESSSYRQDLGERTKKFALRIIKLCASIPNSRAGRILANQLLKSGTAVGANFREARRSRSRSEFRAKIGICLMELDETQYWLELLGDSKIIDKDWLEPLSQEANELLAIFVTIRKKVQKG